MKKEASGCEECYEFNGIVGVWLQFVMWDFLSGAQPPE